MKIIGAVAQLFERLRGHDDIGRKGDEPGAPENFRRERRKIRRCRRRPYGQVRITVQQDGRQHRLLHLAGEQNDRVESGHAKPPG